MHTRTHARIYTHKGEAVSFSRHGRECQLKAGGWKERPIDRRRLSSSLRLPSRAFQLLFPLLIPIPFRSLGGGRRGGGSGGSGRRAEGLPKLEVGIMGRINMQGLDTCGGRGGGWRSNKRGRRGRAERGVGGLSVFVRLMSARVSSPPAPPYRIHGLTDTPIDFTTRYMRIPTCLMTDRSPATRPPPMHLASLHRLRAFARHLDARKKSSLAFSSSTAGKIFAFRLRFQRD